MNKRCAQFGNLCVGSRRAFSPSALQQELTRCSWEGHGGISNLRPASVDLGKHKNRRRECYGLRFGGPISSHLFLMVNIFFHLRALVVYPPLHASGSSYFIP
jgi:hypothetical protein